MSSASRTLIPIRKLRGKLIQRVLDNRSLKWDVDGVRITNDRWTEARINALFAV